MRNIKFDKVTWKIVGVVRGVDGRLHLICSSILIKMLIYFPLNKNPPYFLLRSHKEELQSESLQRLQNPPEHPASSCPGTSR